MVNKSPDNRQILLNEKSIIDIILPKNLAKMVPFANNLAGIIFLIYELCQPISGNLIAYCLLNPHEIALISVIRQIPLHYFDKVL